MKQPIAIAQYVVDRIADLGIDAAFGVPGDYAFPIDDAIESNPRLEWIVCANELNASYAADGYARIRGAALLTTTYGVGELCALGGLMGARAHRLPVFHLVGMPSNRIQRQKLITHHTLGDGVFGNFIPVSSAVACVHAVLSVDNAVSEIERVISEALRQSAPAYIVIPENVGRTPLIGAPVKGRPLAQIKRQQSCPLELDAAVSALADKVNRARKPIAFASTLLQRFGVVEQATALLDRSGLPFAALSMDKGVIDETHPGYLGVYSGALTARPEVKAAVEGADLLLDLGGVVLNDLNTGFWTQSLPSDHLIISDRQVRIGTDVFDQVAIDDVLTRLSQRIDPRPSTYGKARAPQTPVGSPTDRTTSKSFFARLESMLRETDVLVSETGSSMTHMAQLDLPSGVGYQSQVLWGAIGWATPAALGIALGNRKKRTILVTGDGSHQLTANEIGVMGRYGVKPVIFVLNNGIFGVEDVFSEVGHVYDDIAAWNYHLIPHAMGCKDWFTAKVSTVGELDAAISHIKSHDQASYVEVMIPPEECQPMAAPLLDQMYKLVIPGTTPIPGA